MPWSVVNRCFLRQLCVLYIVVTVLSVAVCGQSQDVDFTASLDGSWKSDWELTKQHFDAECKVTAAQRQLFERLMGRMTVHYQGNRSTIQMPEIRFKSAEGNEVVLDAWNTVQTLNVLGRTKSQIALRETVLEKEYIHVVTFVDADTYWVYLGYSPFAGQHVREYFRRLPRK